MAAPCCHLIQSGYPDCNDIGVETFTLHSLGKALQLRMVKALCHSSLLPASMPTSTDTSCMPLTRQEDRHSAMG